MCDTPRYTGHEMDEWYTKFEEECVKNGVDTKTAGSVIFFALLEMTKEKDPQSYENIMKALSPDEVRGVVRCKDCTFGEHERDGDGNPCVLCGNSMVFDYPYAHDPDWFCADGEMKGAEDGTTD